jgi:hypothetical protein
VTLSAEVRTNTGERLGWIGGAAINKLGLIGRADRGRFPMVYGIDPYSDTTFNGLQMEMLADELKVIAAEAPDPDVCAMAMELLGLVEVVLGGVHRTLVLIGD